VKKLKLHKLTCTTCNYFYNAYIGMKNVICAFCDKVLVPVKKSGAKDEE